jgi:hypothetical protein
MMRDRNEALGVDGLALVISHLENSRVPHSLP